MTTLRPYRRVNFHLKIRQDRFAEYCKTHQSKGRLVVISLITNSTVDIRPFDRGASAKSKKKHVTNTFLVAFGLASAHSVLLPSAVGPLLYKAPPLCSPMLSLSHEFKANLLSLSLSHHVRRRCRRRSCHQGQEAPCSQGVSEEGHPDSPTHRSDGQRRHPQLERARW